MSDSVRVLVKVIARPETVAQVRGIVLKLATASRKENGCVSYDVLEDKANPAVFALVEEWTSAAALDAHNKTPHFAEAVSSVQSLLGAPLEVGRYATIL
jgi:quinol monooxygenase YgiN